MEYPDALHITEQDREFLMMAFEEAERAREQGTYPIGAIVVDPHGQVVGRGHNRVFVTGDVTLGG